MWRRSFVATAVALGESVDDALGALAPRAATAGGPEAELVAGLRAPERALRAAALAGAVRDVMVAASEVSLR